MNSGTEHNTTRIPEPADGPTTVPCPQCRSPIVVDDVDQTLGVRCLSCDARVRIAVDQPTISAKSPGTEGARIGRFELIDIVGSGAFGSVYQARDPELDRIVAIKLPRAGALADPDWRERLFREARSIAKVRHPAIVPVYEVGEDASVTFLVSEFVIGQTLAEVIASRELGFREAAELTARIAEGLHEAHEAGVVHRDVKPSNIMIDATGAPRLLDFGMAKRNASEVAITMEGQMLGTPAYMSPEQARGDSREVDRRADVYSLGVVLYQLLTGETPFRGNTRMLLLQVLNDEPRPPRTLNDRISKDLETITLKALAKLPDQRYPTAAAMAADLNRHLEGKTISARPAGPVRRGLNWARRKPQTAALSIGIALATAAAIAGISLQWRETSLALDRAERNLYFNRIALAESERLAENPGGAELVLDQCPRELRGWEWRLLKRSCREDVFTYKGHQGRELFAVAADPRGDSAATAGEDRRVRIWNYRTGLTSLVYSAHHAPVRALAYSPNGELVASATGELSLVVSSSEPGTIHLWKTSTGTLERSFEGHESGIDALAFSPDGERLVSVGIDRSVRVWNVRTGKSPAISAGSEHRIQAVAFDPSGKTFITAAGDLNSNGIACEWDAATGKRLRTVLETSGYLSAAAISPEGGLIALGGADGIVRILEKSSAEVPREIRTSPAALTSLAFDPAGRRLAAAAKDHVVHIIDMRTHNVERAFRGHTDDVTGVRFDPSGARVISCSRDGAAKVWSVQANAAQRAWPAHSDQIHCADFNRSGDRLVTCSRDKTACLWNAENGRLIRTFLGHSDAVWTAKFSPDSRRVVTAGWDGSARVWNVEDGKEILHLPHPGRVESACWSLDGNRILTCSGSFGNPGFLFVWDAHSGKPLKRISAHEKYIEFAVFSPDGERIASASNDKTAEIRDARSGRLLVTLAGHERGVTSLAYHPGGSILATGGYDHAIILWDPRTGRRIRDLKGHSSIITSLAFAPDGARLVSTSADHHVRVWDPETGGEALTLRDHKDVVRFAAFSPDGDRLASVGADGFVRIWDATPLPND